MLSFKQQSVEASDTTPRWNIGIDKRQVAVYVGLALVAGFAFGFATARYLNRTDDISKLASNQREASPASAASDSQPALSGLVSRVARADLIEVTGVGPVHMIGVETPDGKSPSEIYGQPGQQARAFTERSLLNQTVRLEFDPENAPRGNKDGEGRTLAYIYTQDGRLFNGELIKQGHAFVRIADQFRLIDEFRSLEREAMQAMRGVWGLSSSSGNVASIGKGAQPGEPGLSSSAQEKKRLTPLLPSEVGPNLPALTGSTPSSSSFSSEQSVFVSGGDRMYHKSGCELLGKKRQALPLSQAKAEGYTSCSRCYASTVLKAPG